MEDKQDKKHNRENHNYTQHGPSKSSGVNLGSREG